MYLLQRMIQWIKGWKEKLLSMGAKEILLKSTIQSMTVFAMLVFKIPKKLCKEMNDVMAWFWWGDSDEQKRMHWAVWCRLCVPKKLGGTGFIYLHAFNLAMLAKKKLASYYYAWFFLCSCLTAHILPEWEHAKSRTKEGLFFHLAVHSCSFASV